MQLDSTGTPGDFGEPERFAPIVEPPGSTEAPGALAVDPVLPLAYTPEPRPAYVAPPPQPAADDGEDELRPPSAGSRKPLVAAVLVALAGLAVLTLIILGRWNRDTYALTCEADRIVAEQGRSFPPWGTSSLDGTAWKPIVLPRSEDCAPASPGTLSELSQLYLQKLKLRADALLSVQPVTQYDEANALLEQALLHARGPARKTDRDELERLIGDIGYWRATAKLRDASAALTDAAKQFEAAALKRPKHVVDASAWSAYVQSLVEQLAAGPGGATAVRPTSSATEPSERPRAPDGVALPVEPVPSEPTRSAPSAPTPDAGVAPTGGVLL